MRLAERRSTLSPSFMEAHIRRSVFLSALVILSPLLIGTAIAIRLESKGKVIYKSQRVGSNYRIFNFLKFRSMYTNADKRLKELNALNQYQMEEEVAEDIPDIHFDDLTGSPEEEATLLISDDFIIPEKDFLKQKRIPTKVLLSR